MYSEKSLFAQCILLIDRLAIGIFLSSSFIDIKFVLSRKIHESDKFKYHLMLGQLIKNISVNIVFSGEKNYNNIEMRLTFNL